MSGGVARAGARAGGAANIDPFPAVVIGGSSLFGGRGSIVGTLTGALIVGVFRNGLALAGLDVVWQEFTVGVLIIVAGTLDQWIRRVAALAAGNRSPSGRHPRLAHRFCPGLGW